jgi:hypothetical protein
MMHVACFIVIGLDYIYKNVKGGGGGVDYDE